MGVEKNQNIFVLNSKDEIVKGLLLSKSGLVNFYKFDQNCEYLTCLNEIDNNLESGVFDILTQWYHHVPEMKVKKSFANFYYSTKCGNIKQVSFDNLLKNLDQIINSVCDNKFVQFKPSIDENLKCFRSKMPYSHKLFNTTTENLITITIQNRHLSEVSSQLNFKNRHVKLTLSGHCGSQVVTVATTSRIILSLDDESRIKVWFYK